MDEKCEGRNAGSRYLLQTPLIVGLFPVVRSVVQRPSRIMRGMLPSRNPLMPYSSKAEVLIYRSCWLLCSWLEMPSGYLKLKVSKLKFIIFIPFIGLLRFSLGWKRTLPDTPQVHAHTGLDAAPLHLSQWMPPPSAGLPKQKPPDHLRLHFHLTWHEYKCFNFLLWKFLNTY